MLNSEDSNKARELLNNQEKIGIDLIDGDNSMIDAMS